MNLDRHVVGEYAIDTFEQSERGLKLQTSLHIQAEDLVTTAGEHTLYGSLNGWDWTAGESVLQDTLDSRHLKHSTRRLRTQPNDVSLRYADEASVFLLFSSTNWWFDPLYV